MSTGEPRLATWILEHCISDYRCDSLIGDLVEQYPERGIWWYWLQAVNSIRVRAIRTLVTATETKASAAELVGDLIVWIVLSGCGCVHLLLCAYLLMSWTPLAESELALVIGAPVSSGVLIGAVTAANAIRMRTPRRPCVPRSPAW